MHDARPVDLDTALGPLRERDRAECLPVDELVGRRPQHDAVRPDLRHDEIARLDAIVGDRERFEARGRTRERRIARDVLDDAAAAVLQRTCAHHRRLVDGR